MKRYLAIGLAMILPVLAGCDDRFTVARDFYAKNVSQDAQVKAITAYDPMRKWFIYSYGMRNGEGHAIMLVPVIARDGKPIVDAVTADLEDGSGDLKYLAAAILFETIQSDRRYDICGDIDRYSRLSLLARNIQSPSIREGYSDKLLKMCVPAEEEASASASGTAAP